MSAARAKVPGAGRTLVRGTPAGGRQVIALPAEPPTGAGPEAVAAHARDTAQLLRVANADAAGRRLHTADLAGR